MKWIVGLLVAVALGGCIDSEPVQIEVPEIITPVLEISWSPAEPSPREDVQFSYTSNVNVTAVSWNFGDGTSANDNFPTHAYFKSGWKEITLTAQSEVGIAEAYAAVPVAEIEEVLPPTPSPPDEPATPQEPAGPIVLTATIIQNMASFQFEWNLEPTAIAWSFGDGKTGSGLAPTHKYARTGTFDVSLQLVSGDESAEASITAVVESIPFEPHVLIAIPDSGINPYHDVYSRPERTEHPCTYIENFPCNIPALELTLDEPNYNKAVAADQAKWNAIRENQWFWIPGTVFVAVSDDSCDGICILDDTSSHGTGTTSSALSENPDALIAFKAGGASIQPFVDMKLPVDVYGVSWGHIAPIPAPSPACVTQPDDYTGILYVKSSGNEPGVSTLADCWSGKPGPITVGGAYGDGSQEALAFKEMDVVSYYCRPTAQVGTTTAMRSAYCGTSFASPTVTGALSKVILELRRDTGYTGGIVNNLVIPDMGISREDLRDAMNLTASYNPTSEYPNSSITGVPVNPAAPYVQWGWGFYDGTVADDTVEYLRGNFTPEDKSDAATYQEAIYELRKALYG